jgi:hypothetical protein
MTAGHLLFQYSGGKPPTPALTDNPETSVKRTKFIAIRHISIPVPPSCNCKQECFTKHAEYHTVKSISGTECIKEQMNMSSKFSFYKVLKIVEDSGKFSKFSGFWA